MIRMPRLFTSLSGPDPVICCECGARPDELGEFYLRRAGWEGFSRDVKVEGERVRIGTCPVCLAAREEGK